MPVRIGELLLKEKRITPEQLQEVLAYQKANGGKLGLILVKLGLAKDEEITALLSKQYGVPSINLHQFEIDPAVIKLIPPETSQKYQIIPLSRAGATLTIAMTDPTNVFAMDDIKFMTGYNVEPVVASDGAVNDALEKYYPTKPKGGEQTINPSALDAATGEVIWKAYTIPDTPHASIKPGETDVKMIPINRMVPRSFVTNLASGQQVKSAASTTLRGIAFGGDCGVARVDYSTDGGRSWQQAQLGKDEGKYGFRQWQTQLTLPSPGKYSVLTRSTNSNGVAQPDTPNWNPAGFMRNVVESVDVLAV
jgi:hypothetical protein